MNSFLSTASWVEAKTAIQKFKKHLSQKILKFTCKNWDVLSKSCIRFSLAFPALSFKYSVWNIIRSQHPNRETKKPLTDATPQTQHQLFSLEGTLHTPGKKTYRATGKTKSPFQNWIGELEHLGSKQHLGSQTAVIDTCWWLWCQREKDH